MGRPKGSKNKPKVPVVTPVRPSDIRLHVPKDEMTIMRNRAKRIYWALLEYEKKMSTDITSVRMKDYTDLLTSYQEVCIELRKKGFVGRYVEKGVDKQRVVQDGNQVGASEVGGNGSTSMGVGISPINPLA